MSERHAGGTEPQTHHQAQADSPFPKTVREWSDRINAVGLPPTPDDQSRTWDGRVLNTKEAVVEFLAEIEEARSEGRSLDPHDNPT